MKKLEQIQLDFNQLDVKKEELFQYFGYGKECPNDYILGVVDSFMEESSRVCKPQFGYKILTGHEIGKTEMEIAGVEFAPGPVIINALTGCDSYILLVATVGEEYSQWIESQHNSGDIINLYVADALGSVIAETTLRYGCNYLERLAESEGLRVTSPYSPGYCDWHVREQNKFFSLLPEGFCGITLTDSSLMLPIKSTNCVIGLDKNAKKRPYGCAICKKNDCFLKIARAKSKLLIGLSLAPMLIGSQSCEVKQQRPNILFILSDDHTSQAWGIYGGVLADYVQNDNIRKLADEGCVLNNSFCTNSISVPSRASIMTGAYGHVTGVRTLSDGLDPEVDNIAKRMQLGGYQTALIGKWHLKKEPSGFDYYSVFHDQGDYVNPSFKTAENWVDDDKGRSGVKEIGFSTDLTTAKTIDWLSSRNKDEPFMMFCHFKATHEPWDFPDRMKDLYEDVLFPEPETLFDFDYKKSGRTFAGQQLENLGQRWAIASDAPDKWWCKYPELPFYTKGMSPEQDRADIYQKLIRDYLRCGATIDDNIGKLLRYLDDEGIAENTIVVYVSDQGYFLGEHGMFDKRMMYEESLRMPFVIRYPKEIPAGTRNDDIILNIDFASLLADYAGVGEPELAQGRSFRENLKGDTPSDWRESMYYRYWTHQDIRPAHMGVRNDRYKLIYLYGDPLDTRGSENDGREPSWEFFDLKEDAKETNNLYGDRRYDAQIAEMKMELSRLCERAGDKMWH